MDTKVLPNAAVVSTGRPIQGVDPARRAEIRERLAATFGDRLERIIVYGSRARGDAEPDSDLDIFVILDQVPKFGRDLDAVIHSLYPLQLKVDFAISARPVGVEAFDAQEFLIYRLARRDGILI